MKTTPFRVLFLCTGNSARSQIAEALLQHRGGGRFEAASAGTAPAPRVNPHALDVLGRHGMHGIARRPRHINEVMGEPWNLVITVCDNARKTCPFLPGPAAKAHWGILDPAEITEPEEARGAFQTTFDILQRRIEMLVSLPVQHLTQQAIEQRVREIADAVPELSDDDAPRG